MSSPLQVPYGTGSGAVPGACPSQAATSLTHSGDGSPVGHEPEAVLEDAAAVE